MKTRYIVYIILTCVVGFLIYNKFFGAGAKKRAAMSKESLAIAKTHDLETTLHKFEQIYEDLIKS